MSGGKDQTVGRPSARRSPCMSWRGPGLYQVTSRAAIRRRLEYVRCPPLHLGEGTLTDVLEATITVRANGVACVLASTSQSPDFVGVYEEKWRPVHLPK